MRMVVAVGVSLTVLAGAGWAEDIYRWTDARGGVHYSNTPTTRSTPTDVTADDAPAPAARQAEGEGGADTAAAVVPEEDAAFSTAASLRRNAIERDARANDRRLRELDDRLRSLARARNANAGNTAATGGVVAPARDVQSDEERALGEERAGLAKRADELRTEYGKLRDEVTARTGGTAPAWVDLRPGRR